MSFELTIRMLKSGAQRVDPEEWLRKDARAAWTKKTVARLREAQERCDAAWDRLMKALPEDATDEQVDAVQPPPEQAEVDALHALIDDVVQHDRWPKHLYWSCV
ncbi:MAG TPA: hypothetical protein VG434_06160 [Sphingomicrobium sp.]|nr:hypothetical protein [Sphingomicrobium sp.]